MREESIDIPMVPEGVLEFPMKKLGGSDDIFENRFDITLNVSNSNRKDTGLKPNIFDYLEVSISVGVDSPHLKAIDVYTQYAGIGGVFIKHSRPFWKIGNIFHMLFPDWNDEEDRTISGTVVTRIERPAEYESGTGLRAHSELEEVSIETDGSRLAQATHEIGMVTGYESEYLGPGTIDVTGSRIVLRLSSPHLFTAGSDGDTSFAIQCNNPLNKVTMVYRDYHPIPFGVYMLDYYYTTQEEPRKVSKGQLIGQLWNPDFLKAGKIVAKTKISPGYNYTVKCITSGGPEGWGYEMQEVKNEWHEYDIDQWVILAKITDGGGWKIQPSDKLYYTNAVDFLRTALGADI